MSFSQTLSLWLLVSFSQGVQSAHWASTSPNDGQVIYACTGETITLPWQYVLDEGETTGDMEWFYDGGSQEMIALHSHDNFLPLPSFETRVQALGNGGISLSHLTVKDSGNYSVEVNGYGSDGVHFLLQRYIYLQIGDDLLTADGLLHVTQNPEVVLDPTTTQWAIQLQCGAFVFRGDPPYQVQWTTPSGNTSQSSDFRNGHFNLLLNSPIEGGEYTCEVPTDIAAEACLRTSVKQTYVVDKVASRLALLEKENEQLKQQLKSADSSLSHLQQVDDNILLMVEEINSTLQQLDLVQHDIHNLQVNQSDLHSRLEILENAEREQIGFHAQTLESANPPTNTPLIVTKVRYNSGNAYDAATGYFTAPVSGVYFFIGTSGSADTGHGAIFCLNVDDVSIDCGYAFRDTVGNSDQPSVHGLVHLTAGQKVWLNSAGNSYTVLETSFTGFLLLPDIP